MIETTTTWGNAPGSIGPAIGAGVLGIQPYVQLGPCVGEGGHRFSIGMYHKDRAVCERCGLIRKAER